MSIDALLKTLIGELDDDNTVAFGLTGSFARGDAVAHSDVDLWQFVEHMPGDRYAPYTLRQRDDRLVSLSIRTIVDAATRLERPDAAITAVPGLRQMRILLDKTGDLEKLVQAAHDFRWDDLRAAADEYASHDLLGNAEEAHKIMNGLEQGDDATTLFWLMGLIWAITRMVAVYKGLLIESDNHFFREVQLAVGDESAWTHHHRVALGLVMASPRMRARAGLSLYRETAALLAPAILPDHRPVIEAALKRIAQFVA